MLRWLKRLAAPVVAVALLGMAGAARADTIAVAFLNQFGTTFSYTANLSDNGLIAVGDGFTIFDFAGPQSAVVPSSGWTASAGTGSPNAAIASAGAGFDDPAVPNVSFIWNGSITAPTPGSALGTFSILSLYSASRLDWAVSKDSGSDTEFSFGPMTVAAVPLPATASMGGALLACVAVAGIWRRRNSSQAAV
jgi:hypothetical protein